MRSVFALVLFLTMGGVALADEPASSEDAAKVAEVLKGWGCEGGEVEKEGSGMFEVEDASCGEGEYDLHLDADFSVFAIIKH